MKNIILFTTLCLIFGTLGFVACDGDKGPTAPTSVAPAAPAPVASAPAPTATPSPTAPTTPPPLSELFPGKIFNASGGMIRAQIGNQSGSEEWAGFACYENPTGEIEDQKLFAGFEDPFKLQPGQGYKFKIALPDCAWQCDVFVKLREPLKIPYYNPSNLVAFAEGGSGICQPPPCVEDCDPNKCVKTSDPSGPGKKCSWNQDLCQWTCECIPTTDPECPEQKWNPLTCSWVGLCLCEQEGEPECPEQKWDPVKCKWVGDCECEPVGDPACPEQTWDPEKCKWVGPCECVEEDCPPDFHWHPEPECKCVCSPIGEPECPEQTWDEKTCSYVGDCECEPVGEPECPEQTWDTKKCKWVGPCVCEPVGEPECPEQVWSEKYCKWKGDCPCPPQQCSFGYEWDEKKCKCEPVDICHVSNGGQPGECDWNLQEQNKKFTPGHGGHMDPASQCPPDYFGECNGRYSSSPHSCQLTCQQ